MGRLLVLRHAQSVWNAAGLWQGWADTPLSELGIDQARRAGRALAASGVAVTLMACSDLGRARSTAALIAQEVGYHGPLHVDPELKEHDVGEWNGLTTEEIVTRWPGQLEARAAGSLEAFPGGEDLIAFRRRVERAAQRLAVLAAAHDGDVVAVSHGGAIAVIEQWLGVWRGDRRHPNLSGWWLAPTGRPPGVGLKALSPVQLLPSPGSPASTVAGTRPAAATEVA